MTRDAARETAELAPRGRLAGADRVRGVAVCPGEVLVADRDGDLGNKRSRYHDDDGKLRRWRCRRFAGWWWAGWSRCCCGRWSL